MPKVENNQANRARCFCPNCPTFDACAKEKGERLYCSIGRTAYEFKRKGCLCGACPVHAEHKLRSGYFCFKGAAQ